MLFHRPTGHNLSAGDGALQLAVRRAKSDDLHFHDLRHTFSTRVRAFTDSFTVRDLMGHKKVDTTDIYATTPPADMRTAVEAMANRRKALAFKTV